MAVIEKEFSTGYNEDIPSDLSALSMRLLNKQLNAPDILYAYAIMIYALKESLRMACQLLFGAICGGDLVVLNNDNLINRFVIFIRFLFRVHYSALLEIWLEMFC